MKMSKKQFESLAQKQGNQFVAQNVVTRTRATRYGMEEEVLIGKVWIPLLGVSEKYFFANGKKVFVGEQLVEKAKEAKASVEPKVEKAKEPVATVETIKIETKVETVEEAKAIKAEEELKARATVAKATVDKEK